ncbi:MAG TPA: NHL repeat-containing protein [Armatimonadota bacterium]|jgi:hypothetical protein
MSTHRTIVAAVGIALMAMAAGSRRAFADGEIPMRYLYASYGFSSVQRFSRPSGLFYDSKRSELYVADSGHGQIVILDKKGMPIIKIPHYVVDPVTGNRNPGEPKGVVVQKNGDILIIDNQCTYLDVLDFQGRSVRKVWPAELLGQPKGKIQPRCLALDPAGNVYLGLTGGDKEIMVLTPDLKLKTTMGVESKADWIPDSKGVPTSDANATATDVSKGVTGLWADKDGIVYASYALGVCVRAYAPDGKQLMAFGTHDAGPQNFSLPAGLITDSTGRLWVVDTLRHVVSVFTIAKSGQTLTPKFLSLAIGGLGQGAGDLSFPSAITGDGGAKIYVAESAGARVQGFQIEPPVSAAPPSQ